MGWEIFLYKGETDDNHKFLPEGCCISITDEVMSDLGVVHNCQHLCINTESTRGGGEGVRGQRTIF